VQDECGWLKNVSLSGVTCSEESEVIHDICKEIFYPSLFVLYDGQGTEKPMFNQFKIESI
jgi:hypothetical protein